MWKKLPNKLSAYLKDNFAIIMICLVGAVLRFTHLSGIIFHLDEPMHTVKVAANSLSYNLTSYFASMSYQVMTHFLLPMGKLEFVARLPTALFGVLIILGAYFVGKMLFGRKEGIIAALFVCFSHYLINYSQYARSYTMYAFFSLVSLFFFYKALKENQKKYWVFYLLFTIINIYTHLFSLVTVFTQMFFVGILVIERYVSFKKTKAWVIDRKRFINFLLCMLSIFAISYLLWLPVKVGISKTGSTNFVADLLKRIQNPPTIDLFSIIRQILTYQIYGFPSLILFLALFFMVFGIIGCVIRLRKEDALLLLYIGLPVLGFFLIKPRAVYYLSLDRYFIFILPLIFVLSAKGITFLNSLFVSLVFQSKKVKKNGYVYKNLLTVPLVLVFFLLECNRIKEYADYVWKLRYLHLSKGLKTYLIKNVNSNDMIFFDSFPDITKVLYMAPLSLNRKQKRIMIYAQNRLVLEKTSKTKIGLWLVLDRSILEAGISNEIRSGLSKDDIVEIDGYCLIHWKKGEALLIKNLIKMVEFLIPFHPENREEYRLLLAKFYLLDNDFGKAQKELKRLNLYDKTKLFSPGTEQKSEVTPLLRFVNQLIYSKNFRDLVRDTLYADIARQLWYYGQKFLSEKKFNQAIAAFDLYVQFSDRNHDLVAKRYVSLGSRSLRLGRIDEAISILKKAIKLDPQYYVHHFLLGEAFREKGTMDQAVKEYREALDMPFFSDEFLRRMIQKPRLFAIWKKGKIWHFMWKSEEKCVFSGNLYFNKGIKQVRKYGIIKKDTVDHYKDRAIEFDIITNPKNIKSLDIPIGKKSQLKCYVKMNDQIVTDDVIFVNSGENPEAIPFSIAPIGEKNTERIRIMSVKSKNID